MSDVPELLPSYRFRGSVQPSAEVSRPVTVRRNATGDGKSKTASTTAATLDIFDVIDEYGGWWGISARDVDAALKQAGDVDTLFVRVNSPGGQATEGVAIANLLRAHPADIRVTVYGLAASAASYVSTAGDSVAMAPGSMMMVHDAWNIAIGDPADLRAEADRLDKLSDSIASLYKLKAGGTNAAWRDIMRAETWYTADEAVDANLADLVGVDPQLPDTAATDPEADPEAEAKELASADPFARAAARFDLSMFAHTPAAAAAKAATPQTPAGPPVVPSHKTKEADTMSDTLIQGLRERFSLADDADEASVLAKADELLEQATQPEPDEPAEVTAEVATAALAKDGKVVVSQAKLDALTEQAAAGAKARAKQLEDERDEHIEAAMAAGKIGRSDASKASWAKEFARDPQQAKADLDSLPARFPVTPTSGYAGDDGSTGASAAVSEADAAELASFFGGSKESYSG